MPGRTRAELLAEAAEHRHAAAHWRNVIEQAEALCGKLPDWAETKAAMLQYIRAREREAADAEARAKALSPKT